MRKKTLAARRLTPIFLASALVLLAQPASGGSPSPATSMPPGAIAYVEVSGLRPVIDRFQNSDYLKLLLASQPYQDFRETPQFRQAEAGRKILETQLGMDLWTAGRKLLGGQLALAIYPKPSGDRPDVVAIVRGADPKALAILRQRIQPWVELAGEKIKTTKTGEGVELIEVSGKAYVALHETWVAASNNQSLLDKTLALLSGKAKESLAGEKSFSLTAKKMGGEHLVRAYVNTGALAAMTGGRLGFPKKSDNPLASLALGGILELIAHSPWAGFTLDVEEQQFVLTAAVEGNSRKLGPSFAPFFLSGSPEAGAPALVQPPRLIGGLTIHRDFPEWYRRREELLQPQLLPDFDKFETGLANLLPGSDFEEDVLPLIGKNFTFVAAAQNYDHLDGEPGVKLPGFALIVELAKPREGEQLFKLFFQTLSGVLNLQAGQQGRQPWVLETEIYKDVPITLGRYLKKPMGKRLPLSFNFIPASARVDNQFIISSSVGLCRGLIDELSNQESKKRVNKNFDFQLHFEPLVGLLRENQDFFQAQRIQEGRTPDEAKQDVTTILELLQYFKELELSTSEADGVFKAQFRGSWR